MSNMAWVSVDPDVSIYEQATVGLVRSLGPPFHYHVVGVAMPEKLWAKLINDCA